MTWSRSVGVPTLAVLATAALAVACGDDGGGTPSDDLTPDAQDPRGPTGGRPPSMGGSTGGDENPPDRGGTSSTTGGTSSGGSSPAGEGGEPTGTGGNVENPLTNPAQGPPAGTPEATCAIPAEAGPEDASSPDRVVGSGTPESCTGQAFVDAVAEGGVITFDCGAEPVTITLTEPAKVFNDASDRIVIDGGGLVTLSGGGTTRILYMNTCDPNQVYTTDHCQDQEFPELTVQNLTFIDANSKNEDEYDGGGAIWVRGGRFKIVNSRFFNNVCADEGPDVGGAGVRVFSQYQGLPVYLVNSTFGGAEGFGNTCANGGGISSIGVSWTILNSVFSYNHAIGEGGNPAESGTPGGGSGGAIYNDGDLMTLSVCGSLIEHNQVNAYGSAIFFVSNDHSGTIEILNSTIRENTGGEWNVLPGVSMHEDTNRVIENSTIE